jgi:hypothetical protein
MHPERPHSYRVTLEEADGRTYEHMFVVGPRERMIGDVLEQGQRGWSGPRVTIEEIDRHPDTNQDGAARAWPLPATFQPSAPEVTSPVG